MFLGGGVPGDGGNTLKLFAFSQIYWILSLVSVNSFGLIMLMLF